MKGPDSADFLHRLSTLNIKAMRSGHGSLGFFLNAQGRVKGCFYLWRLASDEFFFEFDAREDGHWRSEILGLIDQFHFAEKFSIEHSNSTEAKTSCVWIFPDEAELKAAGELSGLEPLTLKIFSELLVLHHGNKDFGSPWVSVWGPMEQIQSWLKTMKTQSVAHEELERSRISAARPWIEQEITDSTIPLEVGLGIEETISSNKGCYPGQEVIERIISLGAPAKRLVKLSGSGPVPSRLARITLPGSDLEIGQITSSTVVEGGFIALALLKKAHAREQLVVHCGSDASIATILAIPAYV